VAILIATPGDPLANSYTTPSRASAFLTMRLDTAAWDEASVDDQSTALQWATRLLDEQVQWYGMPTSPAQALALPQVGLVDQWERIIPSTVIPLAVEQATALYALALLESTAPDAPQATGDLVIKSKKIGDTTITYQDMSSGSTARTPVSPHAIPAEVKALLRHYGRVPGSGMIPVYRA
jgi:Putative DnaT-like ssDNA binding protein